MPDPFASSNARKAAQDAAKQREAEVSNASKEAQTRVKAELTRKAEASKPATPYKPKFPMFER